jgi:hypothetical protein
MECYGSWMWSITWCENVLKLDVWIDLSIMACQDILNFGSCVNQG